MVPFDVPFTDAIVVGGGTLLDHLRMQRVVPRRRTFRHFLMIDHLAFLTRASIFDSVSSVYHASGIWNLIFPTDNSVRLWSFARQI